MKEATRKVILRLKEVKEQKKLSCQDIFEICVENGDSVSPSTVRRICAKGSEDGPDFRAYSIDSVFRAVVGTEEVELSAAEEAALTDTEKEVYTENLALKAVVELRDLTIADLQQQIEALTLEKTALETTISTMQIKLDTTTDIIRLAMESFGKGSSHI